MIQNKKTLATSFASVADNIKENTRKVNINNDIDENRNINTDTDNIVKSMVTEKPQRKNEKKLTGIYFDPDVSAALDDLKASGKLKVSKSVFVNNVVKAALRENGLM